jgi:dTDP-4-amino-4,6-dideoxy-D-galactose acyltransferase
MSAIVRLAWDSEFFGFPIARVTPRRPDASALREAVQACRDERIRCACLLLDADATAASAIAQAHGFVLRDVRVELDRLTTALAPPSSDAHLIAPARDDQRGALETIAREAIDTSRFVADPGFPPARCRQLYVAFLARGLDDPGERVTLASAEATGFVACHLDATRSVGTIELIAVAAAARGSGLGSALVARALALFADAGLARAEVVTQGANVAAQRLYQRCGFRTRRTGLWFHRWFG